MKCHYLPIHEGDLSINNRCHYELLMAALWVAMSKFDEPGCDYSVASRDPPNATSFIPKFPTKGTRVQTWDGFGNRVEEVCSVVSRVLRLRWQQACKLTEFVFVFVFVVLYFLVFWERKKNTQKRGKYLSPLFSCCFFHFFFLSNVIFNQPLHFIISNVISC